MKEAVSGCLCQCQCCSNGAGVAYLPPVVAVLCQNASSTAVSSPSFQSPSAIFLELPVKGHCTASRTRVLPEAHFSRVEIMRRIPSVKLHTASISSARFKISGLRVRIHALPVWKCGAELRVRRRSRLIHNACQGGTSMRALDSLSWR